MPRRRLGLLVGGGAIVVLVVGIVLAVVGADSDRAPTPVSIEAISPTEWVLVVSCATDEVRASVEESADAVRIDDISGDRVDGDCAGGAELLLSAPLGERTLYVEGERWVATGEGCTFGDFLPLEGPEVPAGCR